MSLTLGILGWPVAHSRSPAMHGAAILALGLDADYVRFPVRPERLAAAVEGLRALGVDGANVTLPHKAAVLPLLDEVDEAARAIGAVNTIVRDGERLLGINTDAPGLVRSLTEAHVRLDRSRVVVLGAGGAARAAVVGLAQAGASEIVVAARRPALAQRLLDEVAPALRSAQSRASDMQHDLEESFASATLLVQATSATLDGKAGAQAFADALPVATLHASCVVTDLVYAPRQTTVLAAAAARGLTTVDGLGMLLYQGVIAFERWTGAEAPVDVMRAALESG